MTVRDHLLFLADIRGVPRPEASPMIDSWIARVELDAWSDRKIEELSKGMQQKVQFVGAVLNDPPLWILDEPFSGLDPINTNMLKAFMEEARRRGTAIIFSTHVLEQAEKLCDDILLIKNGRKILEGPLEEVRDRFRTRSFMVRGSQLDRLRSLPMVASVERVGERHRVLLREDGSDVDALRRDFLREAIGSADLTAFVPEEPDLESIFLLAVGGAET
jgi:ABC-2 type transport system ATP-binding protein